MFRHASINSVDNKSSISSGVPSLCKRVGPSAVVRFIISTRVFPVQCETSRLLAHVIEKVFKGFPPSTNDHSTATIGMIVLVICVMAPRHHSAPSGVSWVISTPWCQSMNNVSESHGIPLKASARLCFTAEERLIKDCNNRTTTAPTYRCRSSKRFRLSYLALSGMERGKSCKFRSGCNDFGRHNDQLNRLSLCLASGDWRQPSLGADYLSNYMRSKQEVIYG